MKQVQLGQFDPARLFTYLLSRLVDSRIQLRTPQGKSGRSDKVGDEQHSVACSSTRAAGEILKATERRWPSRYY